MRASCTPCMQYAETPADVILMACCWPAAACKDSFGLVGAMTLSTAETCMQIYVSCQAGGINVDPETRCLWWGCRS